MNNKYELLADKFSEMLGPEYNIKYYENNEAKWEEILIENMIHGNMIVSNGVATRTKDSLIETQQLAINFITPIDMETFSKAVQTIEDVFKSLYGPICEYSGSIIAYVYNYRSDASKTTIKGTDYAVFTVYGTLINYNNAVLASEAYIHINGQELKGVITADYANLHSTDGMVCGLQGPSQENYLNGISATLTINLLFRKGDELHLDIMNNVDTDKEYTVQYYNGFITRTYKMMIIKYDDHIIAGDVIKGQIVLGCRGT